MPRYFLELQYKGTNYNGWQIQHNATGVQQKLNEALSVYLAQNVETLGCGRTDTGVHALQFYAHFDSHIAVENLDAFCYHVNCILPRDINLLQMHAVNPDANARFDALSRSYVYLFHQKKSPFYKNTAAFIPKQVDLNLMNEACKILLTYTDFECFSKVHTQVKSFECNITKAQFTNQNDLIRFEITANRFLRGMVRAIVGTLLMVGEKRMDIKQFESVIRMQDRQLAGHAVPAEGLYLSEVLYPYIEPVRRNFF